MFFLFKKSINRPMNRQTLHSDTSVHTVNLLLEVGAFVLESGVHGLTVWYSCMLLFPENASGIGWLYQQCRLRSSTHQPWLLQLQDVKALFLPNWVHQLLHGQVYKCFYLKHYIYIGNQFFGRYYFLILRGQKEKVNWTIGNHFL